MKRMKLVAAAAMLTLAAASVSAQQSNPVIDESPTAGAMAFDLVIVRPVSLVATVLGAGLFVLQLPLSIIQGVPPEKPAEKFVVAPARYTFTRPLGEME